MIRFLSIFSREELDEILNKRRLLIMYCNQKMSCTFYQYQNREIILVFPELYDRMLSAQYQQAYAVLAHEFGHVFHKHSQKSISPLRAQLEADHFVGRHGLAEDLMQVLRVEGA